MNVAMGVRTPAAALSKLGGPGDADLLSRFLDALKKSRRREARLVIARHAHLCRWIIHGEVAGSLDAMKRYLIERDIPKVGSLSREEYRGLAATSNAALAKLAGKVQWLRSHIAADKTFCIYLAESEALVREHSRIAGFPVTK